jgi:hypothetical protein
LALAQASAAQPLAWQHGAVNAAVTPTATADGSQVGGTSKLELATGGLQAQVTGSIATNTQRPESDAPLVQAVGDSGSWTRAQLGVTAKADGPAGSKITVTGQDQITQSVSPYAPGNGAVRQTLETQALSGSVAATVPRATTLDAKLGAAASQSSTRSATVDNDDGSHLQTADTRVSASLSYRAAKGVTLDAGASVERQDADLDGDKANSAGFSYVKPQAVATVTPWQGATVKLGAERAVEPLNGANYMALANLSDRPQDLKIAPDHAWQYQASLDQKIGAASLGASVTESRNGTVTELAPVEGGQTPASAVLKKRPKVTIKASLPLEGFGLSDTQLTSQSTWRKSQIRDPVTGKYRRASAEAPHETSFNLTKDLPATDAKIGLSGKLGTTRDFYQASQSTEIRTAPRLGAFLSYDPGPLSMNLSVDGLVGGAQQFTDTFYNGSRNGSVGGVSTHKANDAHVSFSLKRKM